MKRRQARKNETDIRKKKRKRIQETEEQKTKDPKQHEEAKTSRIQFKATGMGLLTSVARGCMSLTVNAQHRYSGLHPLHIKMTWIIAIASTTWKSVIVASRQ